MLFEDEILDDLQNGLMIIQKKNGFKFGIDAVLLSNFAKNTLSKRTLDLCTGTGIIPLLLGANTAYLWYRNSRKNGGCCKKKC